MTWYKNFKFKIPHQVLITIGLLSLLAIILNGILMALDVIPSYFGWFNFPFTLLMFVGIIWGVEKYVND